MLSCLAGPGRAGPGRAGPDRALVSVNQGQQLIRLVLSACDALKCYNSLTG